MGAVAERQIDCDRLLKDVEDIENGTEVEIEIGNNDVALTFRSSGMQVDILIDDNWYDQPESHFELREWKIVLEGWWQFLCMPKSQDSAVEITL